MLLDKIWFKIALEIILLSYFIHYFFSCCKSYLFGTFFVSTNQCKETLCIDCFLVLFKCGSVESLSLNEVCDRMAFSCKYSESAELREKACKS